MCQPFLERIIIILKFTELWIVNTLSRMESEWKNFEGVLPNRLVVSPHVNENALLVSQLLVLLHSIIKAQW